MNNDFLKFEELYNCYEICLKKKKKEKLAHILL